MAFISFARYSFFPRFVAHSVVTRTILVWTLFDIVCWLFGTIFWLCFSDSVCRAELAQYNDIRQSKFKKGTINNRKSKRERETKVSPKNRIAQDVSFALACIFNLCHWQCSRCFFPWCTAIGSWLSVALCLSPLCKCRHQHYHHRHLFAFALPLAQFYYFIVNFNDWLITNTHRQQLNITLNEKQPNTHLQ